MKKFSILDYKKVGDKMACAFADECELVEVVENETYSLIFEYKNKFGNVEQFSTTKSGKYTMGDIKPIIYPRAGVYTWENEPKLVNYDDLEVLQLFSSSLPYAVDIRIGNKEEGIFFSEAYLNKVDIKGLYTDCEVLPEHLQTQSMKELRNNVINRLKEKANENPKGDI